MNIVDIVIVAAAMVGFVAVLLRMRKTGVCGSCSNAGSCGGACSNCAAAQRKSCPACNGIDEVARKLGQGVDGR